MAIFASLIAKLGFDTAQWTSGTKKAGQDLDNLGKKSKGFFGDLKSQFGKSSMLGNSLKLLAGGGAIAALKMVAKDVYDIGDAWIGVTKAQEAAIEANKQYEQGVKNIRDEQNKIASDAKVSADKLAKEKLNLQMALDPENAKKIKQASEIDAAGADASQAKKRYDVANKLQADLQGDALRQEQVLADKKRQLSDLNQKASENGDRIRNYIATRGLKDEIAAQEKLVQEINAAQTAAANAAKLDQAAFNEQNAKAIEIQAVMQARFDAENHTERMKDVEKEMEERRTLQNKLSDEELTRQKRNLGEQISALEDRRSELDSFIKDSEKHQSSVAVQSTESARGQQFALYSPTIANPMQKVAEQSLKELQSIDENIKTLKATENAVTVSIGGAG